ncbi:MAG: hypothetical protein EXS13_07620 [Planctomycetes bacterium]|nr:hypothetical protein [Planctomycetota bacterium]
MSFLRDAAQTFLLQAVAAVLQLAANALLSRTLGTEGRGVYELLTLLPTIAVYVASLGYGNAAMRFAAKVPQRDGAAAGNSLLIALIGGLATAACLWPAGERLRAFIGGDCPPLGLVLALAAIPILTLELHAGLFLTGQKAVLQGNLAKTAQVALALCGAALLFAYDELTPLRALAVWIASFAVGGALAWAFALRRLEAPIQLAADLLHDGLAFGLRFFGGNFALFLLFRVDLWFVRAWSDLGEVGIYGLATKLAVLFQMSARSIERAFVPRILTASADEATALTGRTTRAFLLVMSGAAVLLGLAAIPGVPLLFGAEFQPAVAQVAWLLPGIVVANVGILANGDLISRGLPSAGSFAAITCLVMNVAVDRWLIPAHGGLGAAIGSCVCYAAYGLLMARHYAKATGSRASALLLPRRADVVAVVAMVQRACRRRSR